MKTFKFYTKNNSNNTNTFHSNTNTDYSAILDNIIAADIIKKNSYLLNSYDTPNNTPIILTGGALKASDEFTKAATFLANYKKYNTTYKLPYTIGKMYKLYDGTPIVFYEDEVQIGFDSYKYSDFANLSFLNNLTTSTKKIIINIYTFGAGDIKINLL